MASYPPPPGQWPPHHPGQPPYGSMYPGPPPSKKSPFLLAVIVVLVMGFGSCVSWCGYEMYKAQTPEGKRAIAEEEAKDEANLAQMIEKLGRVRKNLPSKIEGETRCAAKAQGYPPTVDTIWLDALGRPEAEWDRPNLAALDKVRYWTFSERILRRAAPAADADAGTAKLDAGFELLTARSDAKTIANNQQLFVLVAEEMAAPVVSGTDWTGGIVTGGLVVIDLATEKPLCQAPLTAESSQSIKYGGGVRIKVRGIPSPTVGDTDLKQAVEKDFTKNVENAVAAAAKRIGAK
jgi:hypothetical protein